MSKRMAVLNELREVLNIIVCLDDEPENDLLKSYSDENPAYIGGTFDEGYFYPPQPYPSWTKDKGQWKPPVPQPESVGNWLWNEETQEWED